MGKGKTHAVKDTQITIAFKYSSSNNVDNPPPRDKNVIKVSLSIPRFLEKEMHVSLSLSVSLNVWLEVWSTSDREGQKLYLMQLISSLFEF
jgi:hypothetical protein